MSKQLSIKELARKVNSEAFDVSRVPVYVLLPNDELLPVTNIKLVGDEKDQEAYILVGNE